MPGQITDEGTNGARRYWQIETVVWADDAQVESLCDTIAQVLCPDAGHQPPCVIPWEIGRSELAASDPAVHSLREQVEIEYPQQNADES